jgi:hypothetical protein
MNKKESNHKYYLKTKNKYYQCRKESSKRWRLENLSKGSKIY